MDPSRLILNQWTIPSENPNDDSIAGQSAKHENDVQEAEHVLKEGIRSFESPPVGMDVAHVVLGCVPSQHPALHPTASAITFLTMIIHAMSNEIANLKASNEATELLKAAISLVSNVDRRQLMY